jgi:Uncharacterised nucleotidyltransferase
VLVLHLLIYAARDGLSDLTDEALPSFDEVQDSEILWALKGGLGPLLYRATAKHNVRMSESWRNRLISEDLSARARDAHLTRAAMEIIDVCHNMDIRVTLLKGISISNQYYPAAHLRPMGDIDLLISAKEYEALEQALSRLGYTRDPAFVLGAESHHGVPLRDPRAGVWVELHTALFPGSEGLHCGRLFDPARVATLSVGSTFHRRQVFRLSAELQLIYIAYSWMRDLTHNGIHPSFLATLFDAVYLLRSVDKALNWTDLLAWLESDMATASLYAMLAYLNRHGLARIPDPILSCLASRQKIVGPLQLWLIHETLDRFLVAGRPFVSVLPPPVPGRYSLRYQLRKRLRRFSRALG